MPASKEALREVRDAPDRAAAEAAIAVFDEKYAAEYPKAVACLTKDREPLLAFFDLPTELPSPPPRQGRLTQKRSAAAFGDGWLASWPIMAAPIC